MLKIEHVHDVEQGPRIALISDDADAENVAVQEAADGMGFPELAEAWEQAEVDDDGLLRIEVKHEGWADLQELLDGVDLPIGSELAEEVRQARIAVTGEGAPADPEPTEPPEGRGV